MALHVPDVGEVAALQKILNQSLTLKLFSNNVTPASADTAASYTEVAGGGYAAKTLTYANWTITAGNPSQGLYNAAQDFTFTGVTNAPGVVYGYFVVDGSNTLMWSERFVASQVPFTPINGSLIRITPKYTGRNQV